MDPGAEERALDHTHKLQISTKALLSLQMMLFISFN